MQGRPRLGRRAEPRSLAKLLDMEGAVWCGCANA